MFETSPNLNSQDLSELSSHHESLGMVSILLLMILGIFGTFVALWYSSLMLSISGQQSCNRFLGRCPSIICIDNRIHSVVTRKENFLYFWFWIVTKKKHIWEHWEVSASYWIKLHLASACSNTLHISIFWVKLAGPDSQSDRWHKWSWVLLLSIFWRLVICICLSFSIELWLTEVHKWYFCIVLSVYLNYCNFVPSFSSTGVLICCV